MLAAARPGAMIIRGQICSADHEPDARGSSTIPIWSCIAANALQRTAPIPPGFCLRFRRAR